MPDKHGFNHLGDTVRCIDCPVGGPLGHWPEHKRAQHARRHGRTTTTGANELRRQRPLLTAPPTNSNEEKEATMPTTTAKKGVSAKQVAIDVLRKAGEPLHASEVAKRVLASGRCAGLKGKTPEATISAMLAVGSKPGGPFARVDKGTYGLADTPAAASAAAAAKPAAAKATKATPTRAKPMRTRTSAATKKPAARGRTKRSTAKR
jgi:hypothetical protein